MICSSCGSIIPDGSKFCTECGARTNTESPSSGLNLDLNIPDFSVSGGLPPVDIPDVPDYSDIPDIPEPPEIPAAPEIPSYENVVEPVTSPQQPAYSAPAADDPQPAYSSPHAGYEQPASDEDWDTPSDNPFGYSTVSGSGGSGRASQPRSQYGAADIEPEKQPITKRWWFWVLIGLLAVVLIIVILAAVFTRTGRVEVEPTVESTTGAMSMRDSLSGRQTNIPSVDEIEEEVREPEPEPENEPEPEAASLTFDECVDEISAYIDDLYGSTDGMGYYIDVDYEYEEGDDGWVDVFIWVDGVLDLAFDAYGGDSDALSEWNDILDVLCDLDWDLQEILNDNGHDASIACLNLVEQEDYEYLLSFAIDGDLYYDQVTEVDLLGIDE